MKKIYLDYAATTPVLPAVMKAMRPYFSEKFGNPGSLHYAGQEAIGALDKSRETIARSIGADFREVIFTSSATESNNLALRGVISNFEFLISNVSSNKSLKIDSKFVPRIIISAIEHESILETARDLESQGIDVVYLPVLKNGIVDLKKLKSSLNDNTVLVSIMYANNETGVVQPIAEISKIIHEFRISSENFELKTKNYPVFHTDASQAFQYLDCNVNNLGVDLMTLSSHKIYGPKGAACLYARNLLKTKNLKLKTLISGGNQEFGLRSGTENIPAIVGFAKAVEIADQFREKESKRVDTLRDYLWKGIKKIYPKAQPNGSTHSTSSGQASSPQVASKSLPNILNIYLPGINAEEFLIKLDMKGIAISTGSACKARALDSSHVLEAMGLNEARAKNSLRFSLGRPTTKAELDKVLQII